MQIWPAIDLLDGKAVRLTKGDYKEVKVYFENPKEILDYFEAAGAKHLHLVDLAGARDGKMSHFKTIRQLVSGSQMQIEVGGGIRTQERIERYLELGVYRVILGTAAAENPQFLQKMVDRYQQQIVVGVDAKDGKVALHGWKQVSSFTALEFCKELENLGVAAIIYTDISKDGSLQGTNLPLYQALAEKISVPIIASGGITYLQEIKKLKEAGLAGAIVGKALYEGQLDLKEVLKIGEDRC